MGMYRYKRGIKCSYDRQGYIYFTSRNYRFLPAEQKEKIRRLCREAGGAQQKALFAFVTSDKSATEVCSVIMKIFPNASECLKIAGSIR